MPDLLKEMRETLVEAVERLLAVDHSRRQLAPPNAGRKIGSGITHGGSSGTAVQDHATTGYDSGSGTTTVAWVLGVSPLDGDNLSA